MSRKDAIVLASRTLTLLLIVYALNDVSYLPVRLYSLLHYIGSEPASTSLQYYRNYYLMELTFLLIRIIGFSFTALWLHKCGSSVAELLLPPAADETPTRD